MNIVPASKGVVLHGAVAFHAERIAIFVISQAQLRCADPND